MVSKFLFLFNNNDAKPLIHLVDFFVDVLAMFAPSAPPNGKPSGSLNQRAFFIACANRVRYPDIPPELPPTQCSCAS